MKTTTHRKIARINLPRLFQLIIKASIHYRENSQPRKSESRPANIDSRENSQPTTSEWRPASIDSRKNSQPTKSERRPRIVVISFRELCDSKLSGLCTLREKCPNAGKYGPVRITKITKRVSVSSSHWLHFSFSSIFLS